MMGCRLCGDARVSERFTASERMIGLGGDFAYDVCGGCGSACISDVPLDLARYYPSGYYSYQPPAAGRSVAAALKRARNRYEVFGAGFVGRLMDRVAPSIYMRGLRVPGIQAGWRILDVGCGAGANTWALGDIGMPNVSGADPFIAEDIEYPNGVCIRRGTVEEMSGAWDLVYFHHSFEHVPEPRATYAAAARLLAPGGWLIISTPVFPNAAWDRYGAHWVALDAPRHLFIPSVAAMRGLAREYGLAYEGVEFNGNTYQFWGSEQFQRGIPLCAPGDAGFRPAPGLFTRRQMRRWAAQARSWNREGRGDQAVFRMRAPFAKSPATEEH